MKKNYFWILLVIILFLSCGAPFYYEKAEIEKGFYCGTGIGISVGNAISKSGWNRAAEMPDIETDYYLGGLGSLFFRYGFSENIALFLQLNAGAGYWLSTDNPDVPIAIPYEGQIGLKFRAGDDGAIKISVGEPSLIDIVYLKDNSDFLTSNIGVGFRGITGGLTLHPKISERVLGHFSLNGVWAPWALAGETPLYQSFSGSIGFGVEVPTADWNFGKPINQFLLAAVGGAISALPVITIPFIPVASAACTYWLGKKYYNEYERGSFWWSVGGAYAGALLGIGTFFVENITDSEIVSTLAITGGCLMVPLGAVLGYQLSRNKSSDQGFLNHFEPPSLGIRPEKTKDNKTITALDFRLINARF